MCERIQYAIFEEIVRVVCATWLSGWVNIIHSAKAIFFATEKTCDDWGGLAVPWREEYICFGLVYREVFERPPCEVGICLPGYRVGSLE